VHRIKGSHHHLRHANEPHARPVVPMHRGDLPTGTLRAIIRQAGLSLDEFLDLL
jgi:predicted RNA binding protein YcfA (HicA-like mRNA interferase family)